MVGDIKGYKAVQNSNGSVTTTSASSSRFARRDIISYTVIDNPTTVVTATTTKKAASTKTSTSTIPSITSSTTATTTSLVTSSSSNTVPLTEEQITCSYVGHTSIPKTTGGILFSTLSRIFCCIFLLFMLVAEMPPPSSWTQRFWSYAFPPFGEGFGVGVLGVVQVFVGCSMLSHALTGLPQVSGWFLFIVGFINILYGLAFGASIKSLRSIFATSPSSSDRPGLQSLSLPLTRNAADPAGHHAAPSAAYFGSGGSNAGSTMRKGIVISAPMQQSENAPPVFPQYV